MEISELEEKIRALEEENGKLREQLPEPDPDEQEAEEFLKEFPIAGDFADDICRCFEEDESLSGKDGLGKALIRVLTEKHRTPESFAKDNEFLEKFIFGNETVKKRIIEDYLSSLPKTPAVSFKKGCLPCTEREKPGDVRAAGELARAFFRKNKK